MESSQGHRNTIGLRGCSKIDFRSPPVIPAPACVMLEQAAAGIQGPKMFWIPVFTGMTNYAGSNDCFNSLLKTAVGHGVAR
jgi:hypothetical protein